MNKRLIVLILAILVACSLLFGLIRAPNNPAPVQPAPSTGLNNSNSELTSSNTGSYLPYSGTVISEAVGQKILFFHAPWCPQCRSIEAGIEDQGVPEGLTIIKVDYDTNQALRQKYGVTLQTTFVKIDDAGNFVSKYVAYDEPTFDAVKRNFL